MHLQMLARGVRVAAVRETVQSGIRSYFPLPRSVKHASGFRRTPIQIGDLPTAICSWRRW